MNSIRSVARFMEAAWFWRRLVFSFVSIGVTGVILSMMSCSALSIGSWHMWQSEDDLIGSVYQARLDHQYDPQVALYTRSTIEYSYALHDQILEKARAEYPDFFPHKASEFSLFDSVDGWGAYGVVEADGVSFAYHCDVLNTNDCFGPDFIPVKIIETKSDVHVLIRERYWSWRQDPSAADSYEWYVPVSSHPVVTVATSVKRGSVFGFTERIQAFFSGG
ncbi:hypothetical protein [Rubricoccus marinus]|uniref:hypothetical protein n=1 Tax=Rubricoccus marinus TaxID=716817 RepID=UPI001179DC76|nr:hypothetical protein [Rubricoccus marinus]